MASLDRRHSYDLDTILNNTKGTNQRAGWVEFPCSICGKPAYRYIKNTHANKCPKCRYAPKPTGKQYYYTLRARVQELEALLATRSGPEFVTIVRGWPEGVRD